MTNNEFDALLQRRMELEKEIQILVEQYCENHVQFATGALWDAEDELEEVEAQIAAACAEEFDT